MVDIGIPRSKYENYSSVEESPLPLEDQKEFDSIYNYFNSNQSKKP
jgi:hypothetical protein